MQGAVSDVAREKDSLPGLSAVDGLLPGAACMQISIISATLQLLHIDNNGSVRWMM